ncbi:hypothetical protein HB364_26125 [Pseudoflavitalea sp. X16]|jgi:hypothetical protein|uniref:hypothetical protein n=1 Tax=Paraflavitalea devenefica TaxID=2716334 RepID=UPI00141EA65D|nr:hypothetical protein [Paraflavitalea devenefica]NII28588.1 hypothetical protein [Paraflavitalea devenefica]
MTIQPGEFPVVIQAYQPSGSDDLFVAEQVVYNQAEADGFTSRYTGLLIKARKPNSTELQPVTNHTPARTRSRGIGPGFIIILLLIALIVAGFATGWIQRNLNISI